MGVRVSTSMSVWVSTSVSVSGCYVWVNVSASMCGCK
jgi:hypothetical protein